MRVLSSAACTATLVLTLASCSDSGSGLAEKEESRTLVVLASSYPLFYFTSAIVGDAAEVYLPVMEGDPASWVPGDEGITQLQTADLLVINGAGYESWMAYTSLRSSLVLDTTAQASQQLLPVEDEAVHQHGPEGEHSHKATAFTTWLDPTLAIEQAKAIQQELAGLLPNTADGMMNGQLELENRLMALDQELKEAFGGLNGQAVIFSHPVYQYLQHRYGINGRSLHWEPDQVPGTRDWLDLQNMLGTFPARLMIWEAEPLPEVSARLKNMGVDSVVFSPAGNRPAGDQDYLEVMHANAGNIRTWSTNQQNPD